MVEVSTVVEVPDSELAEPVTPPAILLEAGTDAEPYLDDSVLLDEGPGLPARLDELELAGELLTVLEADA